MVRNSIQYGTGVPLSMSKIPSDDILESLVQIERYVSLMQLKTVLDLYDMEIHQEISMPNYQKLRTMVKEEYRSKTSITKL